MASTLSPFVSTKETTNYARLCRLLVDVGSQALRDTFDKIHPAAGLHTVLARHSLHLTLQSLRKKKILNPTQWGKLYPTITSSVSSANFDITLLIVLMRNICGLIPPLTGWDSLPPAVDASIEANIARVKYFRNTVYGHASQASVDDATFNTYWQDISNAMVGLGGASYGVAIAKLKNECMDPDIEKHYKELLKQWKEDEDSIRDKLSDMEENIKDKLEQIESQMKTVGDKLDTLTEPREATQDEDKTRGDFEQMKNDIGIISEKLNTLTTREQTNDEDNIRDKLEQMQWEMKNMKKMLDTFRRAPEGKTKDEDAFEPTDVIDGIRQLYKTREGYLAPFPWCDEFHFHLDDIYTRLKMVSRKKRRGTETDEIVDMFAIFKPHEQCNQPRSVLIEGRPGMGKTTYSNKLAYDWATEQRIADDSFPDVEVVLLLKCRDIKLECCDFWEAVADQLLPLDVEEEVKEKFFRFLRHNQSKVLLLLDGLDEVPESKFSMLSDIIQGRLLPKCRLIATSRHEAGVNVRKYCDTLLEIKGFTEEDARNFILNYFKTMDDLAQKLLHKMQKDENLKDMMASPLNTALLCLLCEDFKGIFPESRSQLYVEIMQCVLRRFVKKRGLPENDEDLFEVFKTQLQCLGLIALNGLRNGSLYFENGGLGGQITELARFGFLSVQLGGSLRRPCPRYGFLHKSFQEFFAGYYLCCQLLSGELNPESVVADIGYFNELKQVLLFACGITATQCEDTALALIKSITTQIQVNLSESRENENDLTFALECIKECRKEKRNFDVKLARVFGTHLKLHSVYFSGRKIGEAGLYVLAEALTGNKTVTQLKFRNNNIGATSVASLSEALKVNTTLTQLIFYENHIGDAGACSLAEALKVNTTLTELKLRNNNIGPAVAFSLVEAIKFNTGLTRLALQSNIIGAPCASSLVQAFELNTTLTELKLWNNGIDETGAASLAEALKVNKALKHLKLWDNDIGPTGACSLAEAIKINRTLTTWNLWNNNIGDAGVGSFAQALKINTTLTQLKLWDNNIGAAGAESLAEALKINRTLTLLDLSDNNIGDAGAIALAEALKVNTGLTHLGLKSNNVGDAGAFSLAEAREHNTTLERLVPFHLLRHETSTTTTSP